MPTAASWTEAQRSVRDVGHLVRFRSRTTRRPRAVAAGSAVFLALTATAAILPTFITGAGSEEGYALDALVLLPTTMAGVLALAVASAVASGGGRELLSREHGTVFPVSATTDHLGALLLAPLNIAWLIQAWALLAMTAYGVERGSLLAAQIGMIAWIAAATAVGQVVAWTVEWVRRSEHGIALVRTLGSVLVAGAAALQLSGNLGRVLDGLQTRWLVIGLVDGFSPRWLASVGAELAIFVVAVVLGAWPATLAARRPPRDELKVETGSYPARRLPRSPYAGLELKVETGSYPARRLPRSPYAGLVRIDRGSVWRAVPMRRGLAVLAIGPGLVALAGDLTWSQMTILPGLVASGGALLFGVNAWCLDNRGALWRESLPVSPAAVFGARAWVLTEFLLVASFTTIVLAGLRAGLPTSAELAALLCTWVVVVLQVVSSAMRWSSKRPFAVDLRSARATPAPPVQMVGYSTKLAVTTTLTSLVFSGLAMADAWELSVLVAAPFLTWSLVRVLHARDTWTDPVQRARVVTTVAG